MTPNNEVEMDGSGIKIELSWFSILKFFLKEWRTISLAIALVGHAGWTHTSQVNQDKNIQALKEANVELRKIINECLKEEKRAK